MNINIKEIDKKGVLAYFNMDKYGVSAFTLKVIATLIMLIDHIAVVLVRTLPLYRIMRGIGRLSFPIYAFLIVEGFFHTSNRKKYAARLAVFAFISEIPYDVAFHKEFIYMGSQNIFLTLLLGLLAIWGLHSAEAGQIKYPKNLLDKFGYLNLQSMSRIFIMLGSCWVGELISCSYSYAGIFLIICFYVFHKNHVWKAVTNAFFNIGMFGGMQNFGTLSAIPIALYNGKSGNKKYKWFFYVFYPAHLFVLSIVAYLR